jgi:hypothetical protein
MEVHACGATLQPKLIAERRDNASFCPVPNICQTHSASARTDLHRAATLLRKDVSRATLGA